MCDEGATDLNIMDVLFLFNQGTYHSNLSVELRDDSVVQGSP